MVVTAVLVVVLVVVPRSLLSHSDSRSDLVNSSSLNTCVCVMSLHATAFHYSGIFFQFLPPPLLQLPNLICWSRLCTNDAVTRSILLQ